ncbi:MAG: LysR family transcriptional regulator [Lachnospiraceae bacterium]|nr:LysR family transcriptional regulator [Lachnospiraceae bacterium]
MTLQQLRYAETIAERGSMNEAAKALFISQPSLSEAIRVLEKEVGIMIFNRSSRGVTLTVEGEEFMGYARQILNQVDLLEDRYTDTSSIKKHFGVSCQHYSFAVKAFTALVRSRDTQTYEFAIRETRTYDVINDVYTGKSEIGILYLNDFNRKIMEKLFHEKKLEWVHLFNCGGYVYLWRGHPLSGKKTIRLTELDPYPCLSFEQGENNSFYFAEEILSTHEYKKTIKACDRATLLNLMEGLNAYTLCCGIVCEEMNGGDYIAVPLDEDVTMEMGYVKKSGIPLSDLGSTYISLLKALPEVEERSR